MGRQIGQTEVVLGAGSGQPFPTGGIVAGCTPKVDAGSLVVATVASDFAEAQLAVTELVQQTPPSVEVCGPPVERLGGAVPVHPGGDVAQVVVEGGHRRAGTGTRVVLAGPA
ncbi:hypothetical protein [Geodermatophilus sp. SYSU D00700]